ncbi:MAG TPA: DUF4230 domain-containing protein [Acidobacteriota bacterium]|nr:DUF4230 domain-containing protein [Acidobacteriota bacterium]
MPDPPRDSSEAPPAPLRQRSTRLALGIGALFGMVLVAFVALMAVAIYWGSDLFSTWRAVFGPSRTVVNVSQPTVVRQIQQLKRLETVVYTMEKIVEGEREGLLPKFLTGERLLLIVHGEVIAGIDLGDIGPRDVAIDGRNVKLRIPRAQIFTARIDNGKTRVYSRDTGILTWADPNLETEVRREAERQLREAALKDGILQTAEQNARATLSSLLKGFGFEGVEVAIKDGWALLGIGEGGWRMERGMGDG